MSSNSVHWAMPLLKLGGMGPTEKNPVPVFRVSFALDSPIFDDLGRWVRDLTFSKGPSSEKEKL